MSICHQHIFAYLVTLAALPVSVLHPIWKMKWYAFGLNAGAHRRTPVQGQLVAFCCIKQAALCTRLRPGKTSFMAVKVGSMCVDAKASQAVAKQNSISIDQPFCNESPTFSSMCQTLVQYTLFTQTLYMTTMCYKDQILGTKAVFAPVTAHYKTAIQYL